jgi:hypothetical protein
MAAPTGLSGKNVGDRLGASRLDEPALGRRSGLARRPTQDAAPGPPIAGPELFEGKETEKEARRGQREVPAKGAQAGDRQTPSPPALHEPPRDADGGGRRGRAVRRGEDP